MSRNTLDRTHYKLLPSSTSLNETHYLDGVKPQRRPLDTDQKMFNAIFTDHLPAVLQYLLSFTHEHDTAYNLIATVYSRGLVGWKKHPHADARSNYKFWLFRIARYVVLDHHRQLSRRREDVATDLVRDSDEDDFDNIFQQDSNDYSAVDLSYDIELMFKRSKITSRQREILLLHAQDFTVADIAEILGVSPKAVKKDLEKARAKLKPHQPSTSPP